MKTNFLIIIFLLIAALSLTYAWQNNGNKPNIDLSASVTTNNQHSLGKNIEEQLPKTSWQKLDENTPEFTALSINNEEFNIKDYKGKTVFLNFWATWCPPCVHEIPQMIALVNKMDNTVLIAISIDKDKQKIIQFMDKYNLSNDDKVIFAHDMNRKISNDLFQTYKLPETYIISPAGKLDYKIIGAPDWSALIK